MGAAGARAVVIVVGKAPPFPQTVARAAEARRIELGGGLAGIQNRRVRGEQLTADLVEVGQVGPT